MVCQKRPVIYVMTGRFKKVTQTYVRFMVQRKQAPIYSLFLFLA